MTAFDQLPEEEQARRLAAVEVNLQKPPSTAEQEWFKFAQRNIGFEFIDTSNGKVYSKLAFFHKFKNTPRKLNLISEDYLIGWKRRPKDGWTVIDNNGFVAAIRTEDLPTYKRKKKNG